MPVEAKPLFRPDVLRHVEAYELPPHVAPCREKLEHWAELIRTDRIDAFNEKEILPDFLTDFFSRCSATEARPAKEPLHVFARATRRSRRQIRRRRPRRFHRHSRRFVVVLEGKGPKDPLDRPFAGRAHVGRRSGSTATPSISPATGSSSRPCGRPASITRAPISIPTNASIPSTLSDEATSPALRIPAGCQARRAVRRGLSPVRPPRRIRKGRPRSHQGLLRAICRHAAGRLRAAQRRQPRGPRGPALLSSTQKLLDRVLFMAFAEDRGLLPVETIRKAYEHRDPYNPRPVWENFRGLFGHINRGNAALGIHAYNGGLVRRRSDPRPS